MYKTLKFFQNNLSILLLFTGFQALAQLKTASAGFRVEPPSFLPPVEAVISNFINRPAPGFQANNLNQQSKTISNYYGRSLILFFWSTHSTLSKEYIGYLKELNKELLSLKAELLTFGDESWSDISAFCRENEIDYDVIPNGAYLGEAVYGKELGTPRFFLVNTKGYIKHIIPEERTSDPVHTIANLKELLTELMANN